MSATGGSPLQYLDDLGPLEAHLRESGDMGWVEAAELGLIDGCWLTRWCGGASGRRCVYLGPIPSCRLKAFAIVEVMPRDFGVCAGAQHDWHDAQGRCARP